MKKIFFIASIFTLGTNFAAEKKQVYSFEEIADRVSRAAQYAFGISAADLPKLEIKRDSGRPVTLSELEIGKDIKRDLSLWKLEDKTTKQQKNRWEIALREVKDFVDNSGTKDLLCFVALTVKETEKCKNVATIFNVNSEIFESDLPKILTLLAPGLYREEEGQRKTLETIKAFIVNLEKNVSDAKIAVNKVSTYRQGTTDAKAILNYVLDIYLITIGKITKDIANKIQNVVLPQINKPSESQKKLDELKKKLGELEKRQQAAQAKLEQGQIVDEAAIPALYKEISDVRKEIIALREKYSAGAPKN